MKRRRRHSRTSRRGVTLLLTLLLLAILSLRLAQQATSVNTSRISSLAQSFSLESQWIAQGVAEQWLQEAQSSSVDWSRLISPRRWRLGSLDVVIRASAAEEKVSVRTVKAERWMSMLRRRSTLLLTESPERALSESSYSGIECLLDPRSRSAQYAYLVTADSAAPADLLTVWGDGKIDLNRASRDVLSTTLQGFTDAQIRGIEQLRRRAPLDSLQVLTQQLGLSAIQQETLRRVATFSPRYLELIIQIRRGQMKALYHAVVDVQDPAKILEVRVIQ